MATGSNAPVIVNELVAWPPPPSRLPFAATSPPHTARTSRFIASPPLITSATSSPGRGLSSPPLGSFFPASQSLGGYASTRSSKPVSPSSPSRIVNGVASSAAHPTKLDLPIELDSRSHPHHYAPPKRPLSPAQLSRIAQSFGIVVPTLGGHHIPSPTTSLGSSLSRAGSEPPQLQLQSPLPPVIDVTAAGSQPGSAASHHPSPLRTRPYSGSHVVAVIPPLSMLGPMSGTDTVADREQTRRWRRGRLLPLQPTLGAMLLAIAREFGLPSTTGVAVYLGPTAAQSSFGSELHETGSTFSGELDTGPQLTGETWSSMFASASRAAAHTSTPDATPSSTPRKRQPIYTMTFGGGGRMSSSGTFAPAAAPGPLSISTSSGPPLESVHETESPQHTKIDTRDSTFFAGSHSSHASTSASSNSPQTPASASPSISSAMPIFGTIEFDIDLTEARWFDDWMKAGGPTRRRGMAPAEVGVLRELTLVEKLKDERPKFIRDMEAEAEAVALKERQRLEADRERERIRIAEEEEAASALLTSNHPDGYAPLDDMDDEEGRDIPPSPPAKIIEPLDEDDDFAALREARLANVTGPLTERDIGTNRALSGDIPSETKVEDVDDSLMEVVAMLDAHRLAEADTLSSPIMLENGFKESTTSLPSPPSATRSYNNFLSPSSAGSVDPRTSGLLMEDQLRNLEQMMRELSPRDLAISSPSQPRMKNTASRDMTGLSRLPYLQPESPSWPPQMPAGKQLLDALSSTSSLVSAPGDSRHVRNGSGHRNEFTPIPEDPSLNSKLHARQLSKSGHQYSGSESSFNRNSQRSSGAPKRPARPPTPDLTSPEFKDHVVPSEFMDAIKNTTPVQSVVENDLPPLPAVPQSATSAHSGGSDRSSARRSTSSRNSMSLNKLKRQVSTKMLRPKDRNTIHSNKDMVISSPTSTISQLQASPTSTEPVGLFGATSSPVAVSSFASLRNSAHRSDGAKTSTVALGSSPSEFGTFEPSPEIPITTSLGSNRAGFTSRFFSNFRHKEKEEGPIHHISTPMNTTHKRITPAELAAGAGGAPPGPVPPILPPVRSHGPAGSLSSMGTPKGLARRLSNGSSIHGLPHSPTSPHHVRRKPVPGARSSESQRGSMDSLPRGSGAATSSASHISYGQGVQVAEGYERKNSNGWRFEQRSSASSNASPTRASGGSGPSPKPDGTVPQRLEEGASSNANPRSPSTTSSPLPTPGMVSRFSPRQRSMWGSISSKWRAVPAEEAPPVPTSRSSVASTTTSPAWSMPSIGSPTTGWSGVGSILGWFHEGVTEEPEELPSKEATPPATENEKTQSKVFTNALQVQLGTSKTEPIPQAFQISSPQTPPAALAISPSDSFESTRLPWGSPRSRSTVSVQSSTALPWASPTPEWSTRALPQRTDTHDSLSQYDSGTEQHHSPATTASLAELPWGSPNDRIHSPATTASSAELPWSSPVEEHAQLVSIPPRPAPLSCSTDDRPWSPSATTPPTPWRPLTPRRSQQALTPTPTGMHSQRSSTATEVPQRFALTPTPTGLRSQRSSAATEVPWLRSPLPSPSPLRSTFDSPRPRTPLRLS